MTKRLHIDLETRSCCDLTVEGSWKYSKHPTTNVLIVGYALDDEPTQSLIGDPTVKRIGLPADLLAALSDETCEVWAHSASFERHMFTNVLTPRYGWPEISPDRWRCSMALCGRWGLPQSLADAAKFLGLQDQKDKIGHALMLKMCKPRKVKKSTKTHWWESPSDLERLAQYCRKDVDVERAIAKKLPPLEPEELAIWQWTEAVNDRGITIDLDLVDAILEIIAGLDKRDLAEFQNLTDGVVESPRQVAALRDWLENETDCVLDDLRAATVRDAISDKDVSQTAKKALEARQNLSKSSLAKFHALWNGADLDDLRLRGHLRYCGAHTGR